MGARAFASGRELTVLPCELTPPPVLSGMSDAIELRRGFTHVSLALRRLLRGALLAGWMDGWRVAGLLSEVARIVR